MSYLKRDTGVLLFNLIAFAALGSCRVVYPQVTPAPPTVTDQSECASACANLQRLGCREAAPIILNATCTTDESCTLPTGLHDQYETCESGQCIVTCTNFCKSTENVGVWLDPTCVEKVTSCDQVNSCPTPAQQGPSCTSAGCQVAPH